MEHLVLDDDLELSTLGKTISPTGHFLFACTSLYRLSPHDLFPIHVSMSIIIVLTQLMSRPSCC